MAAAGGAYAKCGTSGLLKLGPRVQLQRHIHISVAVSLSSRKGNAMLAAFNDRSLSSQYTACKQRRCPPCRVFADPSAGAAWAVLQSVPAASFDKNTLYVGMPTAHLGLNAANGFNMIVGRNARTKLDFQI